MQTTIVLLPGMDGTGTLFEPFVAALGPGFDVKIVSYPTDGARGYAELERVALDSLPTQGTFIVLGESFSGPIAVSIAAAQPEGLVGRVLCCTFIRCPRPSLSTLHRLVRVLPLEWTPQAILSYRLLGRHASRMRRSAMVTALAKVSLAALQCRLQNVLTVDVTTQLQSVEVPVLYLQATEDRLVPASAARQLVAASPAVKVVALVAPHSLLQVAPMAAASEVRHMVGPGAFVVGETVAGRIL